MSAERIICEFGPTEDVWFRFGSFIFFFRDWKASGWTWNCSITSYPGSGIAESASRSWNSALIPTRPNNPHQHALELSRMFLPPPPCAALHIIAPKGGPNKRRHFLKQASPDWGGGGGELPLLKSSHAGMPAFH